jgi:uncharacterized protein YbcI
LVGLLAARISTGMVQLMSRFTGRGPTKARTTVNTNLVAVVFEQTLTKGELNLVRAGQGKGVANQRRIFQRLMRDEAVALIERLTEERQPEAEITETAETHTGELQ